MNFDLNVDNYRKSELIEMFELPSNYDRNIIEIKETKLRESIINNTEINQNTKTQTLHFLIKAKNILLDKPSNQQEDKNSSFQNKMINDIYNLDVKMKPVDIENPEEHMVQKRKDQPFLFTYTDDTFPGIINPLQKRTIQQVINIDTRFRDNYYTSSASNFNLSLPINIYDIVVLQLSAIELPLTFYSAVSKQLGNNFFCITITTTDDTTGETTIETKAVNIPTGNYNYEGISKIINNELALLGGNFQDIVFLINTDVNYNNGTGQMMVGISSSYIGTPFTFDLNFQADRFGNEDRNTPLPLKFGWMLGFRNGIYTNNLNYVSEGLVDITGTRYIYLAVDDYNNNVSNNFYSAFNSSILNKNILARIPLQTNITSINIENNLGNILTYPRQYFGPVNIQSLNIQLLDEYGRIIDFNNMDFSFCLTMVKVYNI